MYYPEAILTEERLRPQEFIQLLDSLTNLGDSTKELVNKTIKNYSLEDGVKTLDNWLKIMKF